MWSKALAGRGDPILMPHRLPSTLTLQLCVNITVHACMYVWLRLWSINDAVCTDT